MASPVSKRKARTLLTVKVASVPKTKQKLQKEIGLALKLLKIS